MENKKPNRLIHSLSPYLKQHAYNPVDWYEWGPEVFARAESENKLMLISIGYSACHWCHVMAHESFEDESTAAYMNSHFICIKIDREELPDIDQLYMDACQLINGSGGWPLNAFALPDKRPLHAMTYAPNRQWRALLENLSGLWKNNAVSAFEYAEKLSHGIRNMAMPPILRTDNTQTNVSAAAFAVFQDYYDPVFGGGKRAPKFPLPCNWQFLLQYGLAKQVPEAAEMALHTLRQMALGGIHDVLGGGFARYAVDEKWFAPHFEKMLYDNAQLLGLYSRAYARSGDPFFKAIALGIYRFCKSNWLSPGGVYQSAMDADSEGVEGLYYTFTYQELSDALGTDLSVFSRYYQCTEAGNWEHGRNILYACGTLEQAAAEFEMEATALKSILQSAHGKLNELRKKRILPGIDDKCICSWNALLLKGLSEAALYLQEPSLCREAEALAENMLGTFETPDGLRRISKGTALKIHGYLEDYAALIDGLLSLYKCTLKETHLLKAYALCTDSIRLFYRERSAYFAFSAGPVLVTEKFDTADDVIPSGNSMMAHNLYTLSWYFSRSDWREMAIGMCSGMHELISASAPWYSNWAALALKMEQPCIQLICSAASAETGIEILKNRLEDVNLLPGYAGENTAIPLFQGKTYTGKNLVYECVDMRCLQPYEAN